MQTGAFREWPEEEWVNLQHIYILNILAPRRRTLRYVITCPQMNVRFEMI